MATRTLLNEAIAEAESIKEAALANAKAALEESFAPHIKELFSKKVQELEKEDKNVNEMKEKDHKEEIGETEEVSIEGLLSKLDEMKDSEELDEMSDPVMRKGMKGDDAAEKETEKMRLKEEDQELSEEDLEEGMDHYEEDDTTMEQEEEGEMDTEMIDVDEMSEEDLEKFIEDVIKDMVEDGELEPGPDFESEEEMEMDSEEEDEAGEEEMEIDMEDSEAMMEEESDEITEEKGGKKGDEHKDDMKKKGHHGKGPKRKETAEEEGEIDYMKEGELEKALSEIENLKRDLQEVNLLNAKLLYANKIFKDKNLSESQKLKVLESFDKANTAKEAKLVYETLTEGIKDQPRMIKRRSMVSEIKGSASKPTNVIKENRKPIVESDDMIARFQKLAGII